MDLYLTTANNALEVLEKYGVAIIPSILGPDDCRQMLDLMWQFFETITRDMDLPLDRDDPATWNTLLELLPSHGMLFQHWGIGHAEFAWWVRQHPAVLAAFASIWKVQPQDLLVSFDGASFQAPPDRADNPTPNRGWGGPKHWFHSDQSLKRSNRECVQGWVTANEVGPGDSTLCVLEGSHKHHAELSKVFPSLVGSRDWVRYDDEVVSFLENKGCKNVRIICPPGSLVLWDSRTAHYGASPLRNRDNPKFRAVCYVCYLPRSTATPKDLKRKREIFQDGRSTPHWPNKGRVFGKAPQTYGKPLPNVSLPPPPILSNLGKKLAGF